MDIKTHILIVRAKLERKISAGTLVNVAVKRLIDDVDFVRNLRFGKTGLE